MKKSILLLSMTLSLIFAGCDKGNDQNFGIADATVVIIQEGSGPTAEFSPFVMFQTRYGTMETGSVKFNGTEMTGYHLVENVYETSRGQAASYPAISGVNGTYGLFAESTDGDQTSKNIKVNLTNGDRLGDFSVNNFVYSGGRVSADFNAATNAAVYLFFVIPIVNGEPDDAMSRSEMSAYFTMNSSASAARFEFAVNSASLEYNAVKVIPAAVHLASGCMVVIQGEEKILRKNASAFD